MPPPEDFRRHDWVWLHAGWERYSLTSLDPVAHRTAGDWIGGGRPLVVARRLPGDGADDLRLGLALPGRGRLPLHLSHKAVTLLHRPPALREVVDSAPFSWRETMEWLAAICGALGIEAGVYGSLAWQHFAGGGGAFVTAQSDLDVAFRPSDRAAAERLLRELGSAENHFPRPRIDGEIILPGGEGVAWRELAASPERVLVKAMDWAGLLPLDAVFGLFAARAA